jgi:hypothetical protein
MHLKKDNDLNLKINYELFSFITIIANIVYGFSISPAYASSPSNLSDIPFSIEVNDQTLQTIVQQLSIASGYRIEMHTDLENFRISANLENVTLPEAISWLFRKFNHFEVWDEKSKILKVFVFKRNVPPVFLSGKQRIFEPTSKTIITTP